MKLEDLFSSKSCLCLNKRLIKLFWLNETCFLTALIDKRMELGIDEFWILQDEIEKDYWIPRQNQTDIIWIFVKKWILSVEKKWLPAKNWYTIHDEKLIELYEWEMPVSTTVVEIPTTSCQADLPVSTTVVEIPTTIIYNIFNLYNLRWYNIELLDVEELYKWVDEKKLEKYLDYLENFSIYWLEKDKNWVPRWKKEKTWSLLWRLALWKRNNDTNFWKNKPVFPLEEIKQAAVSYWMYYQKKPEFAKPYAEFLKKYWLLDNWKRKEYANMILWTWFIS